ncbi:flagellar biosynthetic protein FliO [Glaciihabitans sp. UYNi722]|uniref:FliO/MopB family protein n=1 Tax=Glaciihabitans sp. UYNi722 TaxID=3156344 RepID=UPI0033953177
MDSVFVALRVILSLAAVVGLLWVLQRRITKGAKSTRATKLVKVVSRQGIAQKASVVVVDVDGQRFLLGVTEHSVTVLNTSELPVEEVVEVPIAAKLVAAKPVAAKPSIAKPDSATAFGAVMASTKAPASFTSFDPKTGQPRSGAFDGSILSAATWKRAAAALRNGR